MNVTINFKLVAELALAVFLIATATVFLWQWQVSPTLLGVSALVSGVAYVLSYLVTAGKVVTIGHRSAEQPSV